MNKIILITASLLIATGQSSAMHRIASQLTKPYIQKKFSKAMTVLHWTLAAGPSFNNAWQWIKIVSDEEKYLAKHTDANEEVTNFITSELEKIHNVKIKGIKVHPVSQYAKWLPKESLDVGSLRQHIIINSTAHDEIYTALKTNDEKTIDKYLAIIDHEGTHQKENHLLWRIAADLTLPFITHGTTKVISNGLRIGAKTQPFLKQEFNKITSGAVKSWITQLASAGLCRYQEYRADNGVSNDVKKLTELKGYLESIDQGRSNYMKVLCAFKGVPMFSDAQLKNISWGINFLELHPLPKKRIEKLDQKIALLEK